LKNSAVPRLHVHALEIEKMHGFQEIEKMHGFQEIGRCSRNLEF
jgi:hypothetical protein